MAHQNFITSGQDESGGQDHHILAVACRMCMCAHIIDLISHSLLQKSSKYVSSNSNLILFEDTCGLGDRPELARDIPNPYLREGKFESQEDQARWKSDVIGPK